MNFLKLLIPFFYTVSWIGYLFYFKTQEKIAQSLSFGVFLTGFLFHSIYIAILIYDFMEGAPLFFNQSLIAFSYTLSLAYITNNLSKIKAYTLGTFFLPLPLIFFLLNFLGFARETAFLPFLRSLWFPIHALSSLLSHSYLLLGLISSGMYILQERTLKKKKFGVLFNRLPSLDILERINERCLYQGFFFLSLGIVTGAIWSEMALGSYWQWSPKEMLSLILWLIYAAMIHQRVLIGWRGKRLAYMFALGSIIFFISFFVVNFYTQGFHTYGK